MIIPQLHHPIDTLGEYIIAIRLTVYHVPKMHTNQADGPTGKAMTILLNLLYFLPF